VFDEHDYNTFYMPITKRWEYVSTVVKYTYVPRGEAIQDTDWGDWGKVSWQQYGNYDCPAGVLEGDGEYLYQNVCGKCPVQYQTDSLTGFPIDDPTDFQFDLLLDEFYYPNAPIDAGNVSRTVAEAGRIEKCQVPGQFYMAGDAGCLMEMIDAHKMIDGSDQPFASDGSGYVIWSNSNGDFHGDKNMWLDPTAPQQFWSCTSYEPRNNNNIRDAPSPADLNGFMLSHLEFCGLFSGALWTQDGSGIEYLHYADDSFSAGGDNAQKRGNGQTLDVENRYDGIYVMKIMQATPASQNIFWDQLCWIAWDSDAGIISNEVAVEDAAPAAFTVAQNTPNPFNPTTTINFNLAQQGQVSVDVFNVAGQKIATLANDVMSAGNHSVTWDATGFAAGVYFYTVKSGDYSKTMKMTLLK